MSQQALDLRRFMRIVRRHRKLVAAVAIAGLLIGGAYCYLKPPTLTATALVVLPEAPAQTQQGAATGTGGAGTGGFIDTQAVVAASNPVLSAALPHIQPATSLQALEHKVQVTAMTDSVLSVMASGGSAGQAEVTANAVANSYVAYITAKNSPFAHVPARVLEPAVSAGGAKLSERVAEFGLLGALAGALIGCIAALAIGRSDRRLRERDAIANSVGLPVLASFPVQHPSDPQGWTTLLEEYEPAAVYSWRLRTTLQQLGITAPAPDSSGLVRSVTIVNVASDTRALALGPQLASFAASVGIPTALVIGPQQDEDVIATLRAAGVAGPHGSDRMRRLRVVVADGEVTVPGGAALVVAMAVVDPRTPRMPLTVPTDATMLGVTAGAATAEQLARAATAAAAGGREVSGILVADPDPDDQTTGRIPRLAAPARRSLPTRVKDVPTEIRR